MPSRLQKLDEATPRRDFEAMQHTGKKGKERRAAPNAGVMLVGDSAQHGGLPAALLGGRWYTGKQVYVYTDFGGGVAKDETAQQGAFREFAEELLGQNEEEAKATAMKLFETASLVGGRPFLHKGYAMFIVRAEDVLKALDLLNVAEDATGIDRLLALAKQNSELTSVALVGLDEMLRGALSDGCVQPLSVRNLDDQHRSTTEVWLRQVMVGSGGSVATIRDALQTLIHPQQDESHQAEAVTESQPPVESSDPPVESMAQSKFCKPRRWNRSYGGYPVTDRLGKSSTATPADVENSTARTKTVPYIFDMETGDPDDVLTLLFLGSRPEIELRAVTVTPGSNEQIALVRWLLQQMDLTHVRLGAQDWPKNIDKPVKLSSQFYKNFGRAPHGEPRCERADQVLLECCDDHVTLVTGAALHNLGDALKLDGFRLGRWVAQGGFAGEGVVPSHLQMEKFKGMETCPTWNFCGNIPAAQAALASSAIAMKICVSKNVCHSVNYDGEFHASLGAAAKIQPEGRRSVAFEMMHRAMDDYLRHKPGGKKLHDPLALAVAINESVCELVEVDLFCQKGKWGSRLSPGSNVWISISYNAEKFVSALLH